MLTELIDKLLEKLETLELTLSPAPAGGAYTDTWTYCSDGGCSGDCVGGCDGTASMSGTTCSDGSCSGDCVGGCEGTPAGHRW